MSEGLKLVLAGQCSQEHQEAAAEMLSTQWGGTVRARLRSLRERQGACILLSDEKEGTSVVGHSRVSPACASSREETTGSCIIASVLVDPAHRGKGLGKVLMGLTEEVARDLGYCYCCLTPAEEGLVSFYQKLEYSDCEPISTDKACMKKLSASALDTLTAHFARQSQAHGTGSEEVVPRDARWMRKRLRVCYPLAWNPPERERGTVVENMKRWKKAGEGAGADC
eukprot:Hpha_TRINITY_DN23808_c0_g1::TRINITY_DN23808_c0_g1_i1::g.109977::m.109977